jgi:hypothetical protein
MPTINPHGKEIISVSRDFHGRPLTLEVNRVGFRSTASVLVRYGDTVILGTAQVGSKPIVLDYFPLSIDYEEKFYAAGKISGSRFIKRGAAIVISICSKMCVRPFFESSIACFSTLTGRPCSFMSIWIAVIPSLVPVTLKSMSPAKSSASAMS